MRFRPIYHSLRHQGRSPQRRRSRARCCLGLESLEDRTPLSAGLTTAVDAPVAARAVEIVLIDEERILTLEWASLEFGAQSTTSAPLSTASFDPPTSTPPLANDITPLGVAQASGTTSSSTNAGGSVAPPALSFGLTALVESATLPALAPGRAGGGSVTQVSADFGPDRPLLADGPLIPELIGERLSDGIGMIPGGQMFSIMLGPGPWRPSVPANDDDDTDMSFAGTLENIDTLADSPTPTTMTSSPGRTTGRPWSVVLTEPQLLADSSIEVAGASGLSYLASSGLSGLDTALSSGAVDEVFAGEDGVATEPVLAASIATGGISLNVLLGGPDLPGKADARCRAGRPAGAIARDVAGAGRHAVDRIVRLSDVGASGSGAGGDVRRSRRGVGNRVGLGRVRDRHGPGSGADVPRHPRWRPVQPGTETRRCRASPRPATT